MDSHGSLAVAKDEQVVQDTDMVGRCDDLKPVELLLSSRADLMPKGIERVMPMLSFQIEGAEM